MLQGLSRVNELSKAQTSLGTVLRSADQKTAYLHPLVRMLGVNFQERQKLQAQNDKITQQLKASQERNDELQEKLNALANIERSIPIRPATNDSQPKPQR